MTIVPLKNSTALREELVSQWMPGPQTRGTMDILWACLTTIVLCVYTAVHLNIPPPGERPIWHYLRKAKWICLGIFTPEVVLFTAFSQSRAARKLAKQLAELEIDQVQINAKEHPARSKLYSSMLSGIFTSHAIDRSDQPCSRYDLVYGFYAIMGGLRVSRGDSGHKTTSLALGPDALLFFARQGCFFPIDKATIQDKSKADILAKMLVCSQVFWMLAQCTARAAGKVPLTMLELHTFVHVVCAIGMYSLWFHKPLNISEATVVPLSQDNEILLSLLMVYHCFQTAHLGRKDRFFQLSVCDPTSEMQEYLRRAEIGARLVPKVDLEMLRMSYDGLLFTRVPNHERMPSAILKTYVPAMAIAAIAYGGVHAAAWNWTFPTISEKWLWRASCLFISVSPFTLGGAWLPIPLMFYVFARAFIVVESFLSLRLVPIGVYMATPWTSYIPHI